MAIGLKNNDELETKKKQVDEKEPKKKRGDGKKKEQEDKEVPKNIAEPENEKNAKKIGPGNVVVNERERKMTIVASSLMDKKSTSSVMKYWAHSNAILFHVSQL